MVIFLKYSKYTPRLTPEGKILDILQVQSMVYVLS